MFLPRSLVSSTLWLVFAWPAPCVLESVLTDDEEDDGSAPVRLAQQWGTPLFEYQLSPARVKKIGRGVLDVAAALRAASPRGRPGFSNRGGWHSETNLHKRDDFPVVWLLVKEVERAVGKAWRRGLDMTPHAKGKQKGKPNLYIRNMWINLLGSGDSHATHKHSGALLAGVYYVRVPTDLVRAQAGVLKLRDPRPQTSVLDNLEWLGMGAEVAVIPQEGLLVLWPGWLDHYVEPLVTHRMAASVDSHATVTANMGRDALKDDPATLRVAVSFNVAQRAP